MNILAVTYSGEISGGANRSLLMVLKNLVALYGHQVTVIVPKKGSLADALDQAQIPWMVVPFLGSTVPAAMTMRNVVRYVLNFRRDAINRRLAAQWAEKLRDGKYDVVYTTEIVKFFGAYLARRMGVPHVWHFRSDASDARFIPGAGRLMRRTPGRIIAISEYLKQYVCRRFSLPQDKVVMIHNGLDLKDVTPSAQDRSDGVHMLLCARFTPEKGHLEALEALKELRSRGFDQVTLHFAGSVPKYRSDGYFQQVQDFVKENALQDRVVFEGEIKDMPALRRKMNIELMCSTAEAFGRVTVEGMHSGLAVVGSNAGGTVEIISDGENGLLYQQGNARDLADKLETLLRDEALTRRLGEQAIAFAQTHFTMEQNVSAIERVLRECVDEYAKGRKAQ